MRPASGVCLRANKNGATARDLPRQRRQMRPAVSLAWPGGRAGFFPAPIFLALIFYGRGLSSRLQGCGVRGEQCDPGAYKIRTGAVPVRDRGSGHTAPTYIS
jgi:hypothetical protein